jgi:holo-[acyl-carrier protein] synthase
VDLVEIDRVARALARWGDRFVDKLMDPEEAARLPADGAARAHAVAFAVAAKEAASKALGTGWSRGVRWRDVVVELADATGGEPRVRLLARAAEVARAKGSDGSAVTRLETRGGLALGEVWLLGAKASR